MGTPGLVCAKQGPAGSLWVPGAHKHAGVCGSTVGSGQRQMQGQCPRTDGQVDVPGPPSRGTLLGLETGKPAACPTTDGAGEPAQGRDPGTESRSRAWRAASGADRPAGAGRRGRASAAWREISVRTATPGEAGTVRKGAPMALVCSVPPNRSELGERRGLRGAASSEARGPERLPLLCPLQQATRPFRPCGFSLWTGTSWSLLGKQGLASRAWLPVPALARRGCRQSLLRYHVASRPCPVWISPSPRCGPLA